MIVSSAKLAKWNEVWKLKYKNVTHFSLPLQSLKLDQLIGPYKSTHYKISGRTKPQECSYLPTILAFHHELDRTYSSLTVQLEAVIIEVPTVQALRLRANPQ